MERLLAMDIYACILRICRVWFLPIFRLKSNPAAYNVNLASLYSIIGGFIYYLVGSNEGRLGAGVNKK